MTWTKGQTIQLVWRAGHQVFSRRAFALEPSMVAMLLKKTPIMTGAKASWSQATRARISMRGLGRFTRRARKPNQVVAMGPKTPVKRISCCHGMRMLYQD